MWCSGGRPDAHATSCGAACRTRFPKVALTHRRVQHSRGHPRTASRAARRPELFLLNTCTALSCITFHCRFASTCQEHAQLMRPPKRTTAFLQDPAHRRPCHADRYPSSGPNQTSNKFAVNSLLPQSRAPAMYVLQNCRFRQVASVNSEYLWDTLHIS